MSNNIWSVDDSKSGLLVLKPESRRSSSTSRSTKYSLFAAVIAIATIFTVTAVVLNNKHTATSAPDQPQSVKATDLTNQDFVNLKNALKQFVMQDPTSHVRKLVRLSFHDLATITSSGASGSTGCIQSQAIQSLPGNEGLSNEIAQLAAFVTSRFPTTPYTFGDVISLAGKVAVETAYPCLNIPWKFGRSTCSSTANPGPIPQGQISTVAEINPFLDRYGLSQNDMAILLAGAHGITGANAEPQDSGFGAPNTVFADVNSGLEWIKITVGPWGNVRAANGFRQFIDLNKLRLPIDFLFFPSVANLAGAKGDSAAAPVESFMRSFLDQPRSAFDSQFEQVYAKMLLIGTANDNLKTFQDPDGKSSECSLNFPPAVPLPPVQPSTTILAPTTSAVLPPATTVAPPSTPTDIAVPTTTADAPVTAVPGPDGQQRVVQPTGVPAPPFSTSQTTSPSPTQIANSAVGQSTVLFTILSIAFLLL